MVEVAPLLRKAYVAKLANIQYLSKVVPPNDTFEKFKVTIGDFEAYILIKDITVNDDSPKCMVNENVSIQVQVVTAFNANTGESLHSELIGQQVLNALDPTGRNKIDIRALSANGNEATSWMGKKESARQINSETSTQRLFTRNYIFSHKITN
jgi:hypothetical protein